MDPRLFLHLLVKSTPRWSACSELHWSVCVPLFDLDLDLSVAVGFICDAPSVCPRVQFVFNETASLAGNLKKQCAVL